MIFPVTFLGTLMRRLRRARLSRWLHRLLVVLAVLMLGGYLQTASAHPLGQNTFNRQAAIILAPQVVKLHYLLDLAEIPTVSAGEDADTNHDGDISDDEWQAYADGWAQTLASGLVVTLDGQRVDLKVNAHSWTVKPGTAGFSLLRMQADLSAPVTLAAGNVKLEYRDETRADRLGWKEVWIAAGPGARLVSSDVADHDRSALLTDFKLRDTAGTPDELSAHAELVLGVAPAGETETTLNAATPAAAPDAGRAVESTVRPVSAPTHWSLAGSFFRLGMYHIATGWDHLMFLLGLILFCTSLRELAKTITAFTLAHSITLALAVEGLVRPPGAWVSALIALTIAYVGAAALFPRSKRQHGAVLAFSFGLVHGFGFAGALAESMVSSRSARLIGLVTFNIGIEAFQLMLICVVVPALRTLQPYRYYDYLHKVLAGSVFLAGTIWLLTRTVGEGWLAIASMVAISSALGALLWWVRVQDRPLSDAEPKETLNKLLRLESCAPAAH